MQSSLPDRFNNRAEPQPGGGFTPEIALLFVGSGCAALIYEIVWFQTLQLVIGASAVSLAVLLGAFMGGMSAGSLLLPRCIPPRIHPLRVLAAIEMTSALIGGLLIVAMPLVGRLYTAADGGGSSSIALRALVSLLLLLPPAMLMGATLPAVSRHVKATPVGTARVGLFYGANIFGAVIGCVLAGFYLLRWFDLATASFAAISLNVFVATAAVLLAARTPYQLEKDVGAAGHSSSTGASWRPRTVYAAIALSGFSALGAEVAWTRLLSLLFGATTYTFSMILAVFLGGLGAGTALGAGLARRGGSARGLLGWVRLVAARGIA